MATEFYIESADRPAQSGIAASPVKVGELVFESGSGVEPTTFSDAEVHGVAEYEPEFLAAEDEDEVASLEYEVGDRVTFGGNADADVIRVRTPDDSGDPAPDIAHSDIVGIVDDGSGSLSSGDSFTGRVVEEGYDDGTTIYNRGNNNFMAVGRAYRPGQRNGEPATEYDHPIRLVAFGELKE